MQPLKLYGIIFRIRTNVFDARTEVGLMKSDIQYYVVKKKAVPEVLLKVVAANRLLDSGRVATVQAVSYTHLDVYKRQLHGCEWKSCGSQWRTYRH